MINAVNFQQMDKTQREIVLKRSLFTQPFFTLLNFPLKAGTKPETQQTSKIDVNRDFYLTEIQADLSEAYVDTTALFDMSVYTGYQDSVYNYTSQQFLPASHIAYDARFRVLPANEVFDDRQRELFPFLIKNGDKIFCKIKNNIAKGDNGEINVMLGGFQKQPQVFVDSRVIASLYESLNSEIRFEYFKFEVVKDGQQTFIVTNDNTPRLILGFSARNSLSRKEFVSDSKLVIQDLTRQNRWNNEPIPLQFFAPRLTCLLDTHLYFLPIEYFFIPNGKLQIDLSNVSPNSQAGYEFEILTRTI